MTCLRSHRRKPVLLADKLPLGTCGTVGRRTQVSHPHVSLVGSSFLPCGYERHFEPKDCFCNRIQSCSSVFPDAILAVIDFPAIAIINNLRNKRYKANCEPPMGELIKGWSPPVSSRLPQLGRYFPFLQKQQGALLIA